LRLPWGGEFLLVEPELQSSDATSLNHNFMVGGNRFLGMRGQNGAKAFPGVGGDREPGILVA
jgi:hypothetical protein